MKNVLTSTPQLKRWRHLVPQRVDERAIRHALLLRLMPGEPLHPGEYRRPTCDTANPLWRFHIYYSTQSTPNQPVAAAYDGEVLAGNAELHAILTYLQKQWVAIPPTFPPDLIRPLCSDTGGAFWPIGQFSPALVYDAASGQVLSWHHAGHVTRFEYERIIKALKEGEK
jgi:hypothetical protein